MRMVRDWKGNLVPVDTDAALSALRRAPEVPSVPAAAAPASDRYRPVAMTDAGEREARPRAREPEPDRAIRDAVPRAAAAAASASSVSAADATVVAPASSEAATSAPEPRVAANFGLSGVLAEDRKTGNVVNGRVLKWSEPPDAHKPDHRWRLHVFKGAEQLGA